MVILKTPAICFKETTKHKLFFSKGSFNASIKLPKNSFYYDEIVPFEVDIDASKLSIRIKSIRVSLERYQRKNYKKNHKEIMGQNKI